MVITEILEEAGYAVIEAVDGASALLALRQDRRIDLLVTDVGLPAGFNGRQLADAARTMRPELRVLFITGFAGNAAIGHGMLDPGMEILTKPFAMEALTTKVRVLIDAAG
jgi:CheY-like chemotaxis protein